MNNTAPKKKQEIWLLVILAMVLALIILISKFVIGINFSLMEQGGYITIGYHEVHSSQMWAMEFESFTGSISSEGVLPEDAQRRLRINSGTQNSVLELKVRSGKEETTHLLDKTPLDIEIPGEKKTFTMTLSGTDVLSGYFSAVWE